MVARFFWALPLFFCLMPVSRAEVLFGLGYAPGQFLVEDSEDRSVIKVKELTSETPVIDFLNSSYVEFELLQVLRKRVETGFEDDQGRYEIKIVMEANRTYQVVPGGQLVEVDNGQASLEGLSFIFQASPDGSYEVLRSWHESNPDFDLSIIDSVVDQAYGSKALPPAKLGVGEVYSFNLPVAYSVPGIGSLMFDVNREYRLKEVNENLAYFDVDARINGLTDTHEIVMEVYGAGRGSHVYHVDKKVIENSSLDLDLNFYLHQAGKVVHMHLVSSGKNRVEVLRSRQ